ncbi:CDF family Co(II)/Ni(II) efflux transporter DmeF [Microvirga sp. BT688]|uniref:CDF family Co(II)/Ni(II) efflux transporter DmeF n=1 Tax=Microvirga sp. TaxID=1873136 RepID=UPI001687F9CB|nr:CDF family Co(II)/Ni(II) efflux transporter DmeF [Microvirga sp.]MBD2750486.1 CDF family Co(II)/Ni(II) efflux transporter DmeF [Microvirga sp.]
MHHHTLHDWQHEHVFLGEHHDRHERRTWLVVGLTAAMMVAEIVAGTIFGSMALVADGWHMSTHAAALAIAALAYRFARKHAHDPRFSFGTGKVGELAAFSSAIILGLIALLIGYESLVRLMNPVPIQFGEATVVAVIGLAVNLASAWLLAGDHHHHGHDHGHYHGHGHTHGDHHHHGGDTNIRAAYLHVLADALTSVLAIVALLAGRVYGWSWLDPVMGVVGAVIIAHWSWGLIRTAGATLLDAVPDQTLARSVRERIEVGEDRVTDLHLWRLGPGHSGLIVSVVSDTPHPPDVYKQRLSGIEGLSHVTVEVQACPNHPQREAA